MSEYSNNVPYMADEVYGIPEGSQMRVYGDLNGRLLPWLRTALDRWRRGYGKPAIIYRMKITYEPLDFDDELYERAGYTEDELNALKLGLH